MVSPGQTRTLPSHLKYARLSAELPEPEKRTPSLLAAELKGTAQQPVALKRPHIVEFLNMSEYTHNVESIVPLDEPLFQPSPPPEDGQRPRLCLGSQSSSRVAAE